MLPNLSSLHNSDKVEQIFRSSIIEFDSLFFDCTQNGKNQGQNYIVAIRSPQTTLFKTVYLILTGLKAQRHPQTRVIMDTAICK